MCLERFFEQAEKGKKKSDTALRKQYNLPKNKATSFKRGFTMLL